MRELDAFRDGVGLGLLFGLCIGLIVEFFAA